MLTSHKTDQVLIPGQPHFNKGNLWWTSSTGKLG